MLMDLVLLLSDVLGGEQQVTWPWPSHPTSPIGSGRSPWRRKFVCLLGGIFWNNTNTLPWETRPKPDSPCLNLEEDPGLGRC